MPIAFWYESTILLGWAGRKVPRTKVALCIYCIIAIVFLWMCTELLRKSVISSPKTELLWYMSCKIFQLNESNVLDLQ